MKAKPNTPSAKWKKRSGRSKKCSRNKVRRALSGARCVRDNRCTVVPRSLLQEPGGHQLGARSSVLKRPTHIGPRTNHFVARTRADVSVKRLNERQHDCNNLLITNDRKPVKEK